MFRQPLYRDALVVGWVVVMLAAGFVALDNNTTWSGHLEADRVAGFLKDLAEAFLWSFLVLLLLAWLRSKRWQRRGFPVARGPKAGQSEPPFTALPWTDRWIRDWRESGVRSGELPQNGALGHLPSVCRHGAPVDGDIPPGQPPVLRALGVSHFVVAPGADVSVTWCFDGAREVVVDGQLGHPACGEARVRIDRTRRVDIVGSNQFGTSPAATASIVAVAPHEAVLPAVAAPPAISLRTDVATSVAGGPSATQLLDRFWANRDDAHAGIPATPRLVGVPESVVHRLRRIRPEREELS